MYSCTLFLYANTSVELPAWIKKRLFGQVSHSSCISEDDEDLPSLCTSFLPAGGKPEQPCRDPWGGGRQDDGHAYRQVTTQHLYQNISITSSLVRYYFGCNRVCNGQPCTNTCGGLFSQQACSVWNAAGCTS